MAKALNQSQKIAVIGAGIVGVSTALELQRKGEDVILIDREGPGAGTSYGNAGVLASCAIVPVPTPGLLAKAPKMLLSPEEPLFMRWRYLPQLLPWLLPYLQRANAQDAANSARAMTSIIGDSVSDHQALSQGTKAAHYVVPSDYVFAYPDRKAFEKEAFVWQLRRENGFIWDEIMGDDVRTYEPLYGDKVKFLIRCPNHGRISDPGAYVKALVDHFLEQGGTMRIAHIDGIAKNNGKIIGVRAGETLIPCDKVAITAGIWSKPIMKLAGLKVPLESERGYHMELWNPNKMPKVPTMVAARKFVITPMEGRIRLAGIVEFGGLKLGPSKAPLELLEKSLRETMPDLTWEKTTTWLGHRPATTDSLPAIGLVEGSGGVYTGFGHQHVGLTGGPKTGRLLAQTILGQKPNIDMAPYSPNRFERSG